MIAWLGTPGIVCALGSGVGEVAARLMAGDVSGMQAQEAWVAQRRLTLGAVKAALPALPEKLAAHHGSRNNLMLLSAALQIEPQLRHAIARYGAHRVGIVLGTSTSGVNDNTAAFRHRHQEGHWPADFDYRRQTLCAPSEFLSAWLELSGPAYTLSTACTSGARALLSAKRLLQLGLCDAVICGGVDSLCKLTINGFASLDAVDDGLCLPFSANRRGINIGEAAALFLMEREASQDGTRIALLGAGASSDAWHISAPEPNGVGAVQAMQAALQDASLSTADIGWVNLHGTGTTHNDAMESQAMQTLFAQGVPCASTKALSGHTLGAAGALEAAFSWIALCADNTEGKLPPHVWDAQQDSTLPVLDLSTAQHRFDASKPRVVMSNSFAFGGNNASLILGVPA